MLKADQEGLDVVEDAGGMNPLVIRLKVPKDLSVEGGHSGQGSETVTTEGLLPECTICGKIFQSAKAVHGHMRVHVLEKERRGHSTRRDVLTSTPSVGETPSHECWICRMNFPSRKSLHGHMRMHPDRTWRGVLPPAKGLITTGWSVTGKRGRQSSYLVSYGGGPNSASTEIGSSSADRAKDSLAFMAMNDKEHLKLSPSLPVSGESAKTTKDAGFTVENKIQRDGEPFLDVPGIKAENRAVERDCGPANGYTCSRCHKSFSKYQSLGGHRSSCNKSQKSNIDDQAAQPLSNQSWLDLSLSLSPPNPSGSGQKMRFDLNVRLEESGDDHMEQNLI